MLIDSPNKSYYIKLGGAKTTNELTWIVEYLDTVRFASLDGTTTGATPVVMVDGLDSFQQPPQNANKAINKVTIQNADTVPQTIIVYLDDNSAIRNEIKILLQVGYSLRYESGRGWYVIDTDGAQVNVETSLSGIAIGDTVVGSTINELLYVDGSNTLQQVTLGANLTLTGNILNAITMGGETLAQTLVLGNVTGGTNIVLTSGDLIQDETLTSLFTLGANDLNIVTNAGKIYTAAGSGAITLSDRSIAMDDDFMYLFHEQKLRLSSLVYEWTNDDGAELDAVLYIDGTQGFFGSSLGSFGYDANSASIQGGGAELVFTTIGSVASTVRGIQFTNALAYFYHATQLTFDSPLYNFNGLTASTFAYINSSKLLVSLTNAAGVLTNNGTGTFSYTSVISSSLTNSHILVGNGSNIATDVAMTGDITISNTGVTAIGASKVLNSMVNSVAWSKITATPTTVGGYGITDTIAQILTGYTSGVGIISASDSILGAIQKLNGNIGALNLASSLTDVTISSPVVDQFLRYNGTGWVNGPGVTTNAGSGIDFYFTTTASDISTYKVIQKTPQNTSEQDISATANNNSVLIMAYASASTGLGGTQIDAGTWNFDIWGYVNIVGGGFTSSIDISVYSRTAAGTETLLFSVSTGALTGTTDIYSIASVQQAFALSASTDRLIFKVYATTNAIINRTIHLIFAGNTHYSNVNTPLIIRHNDLAGLQGGTSAEYYHLTSAEYTGTGTGNFVRATSPVLITPNLGVATATSINGITFTSSTGIFTLTNSKTLTVSDSTTLGTNSITFAGTEALTLAATKSVTFADAFVTSGAFSLTLTTTGATNVTLPTSGTLSTLGYVLIGSANSVSGFSPADATTYFIGSLFTQDPSTSAGTRRIYIPKAGTITVVELFTRTTGAAGTTETSTISIRLNNTTDTTITTSFITSTTTNTFSNTGLAIAVAQGDYIEIKWTTPTWATNPTGWMIDARIYITG